MPSRAIKPKREPVAPANTAWQGISERAPSLIREDTPALPRYVAVFSLIAQRMSGNNIIAAKGK